MTGLRIGGQGFRGATSRRCDFGFRRRQEVRPSISRGWHPQGRYDGGRVGSGAVWTKGADMRAGVQALLQHRPRPISREGCLPWPLAKRAFCEVAERRPAVARCQPGRSSELRSHRFSKKWERGHEIRNNRRRHSRTLAFAQEALKRDHEVVLSSSAWSRRTRRHSR